MPSSYVLEGGSLRVYNFYIQEEKIMTKKYFIGADKGNCGQTASGYPIPDHHLVVVESGDVRKYVFQVREMKGVIMPDGKWHEITPVKRSVRSPEEWENFITKAVYEVDGKEVSELDLVTRYEVHEVTAIIKAMIQFEGEHSPYFDLSAIEVFARNRELLNAEMIAAIEDAIANNK